MTKLVAEKICCREEYKQQAVERWQSSGRSAAKLALQPDFAPARELAAWLAGARQP